MTAECSRAWQAEAALDGRLARSDAESFQRHAATCDCCAREIRALETLHSVGQRLPILTSTPLEQRRLRQSVLRAANELALQPRRARPKRALALGALAALVLAAALVLLVFWARAPREQDLAIAAATGLPTFQIEASEDAAWSSHSHRTTARLRLKRGWFEISVDKLKAQQRFILELPDGELEVKGTRFIVEVEGAKTERVRVHEGRVALRLRGQPSMLLEAGESWPTTALERTSEVSSPSTRRAASSESQAAPLHRPSAASTRPVRPDSEPEPTDQPPLARDDFARAMAAFTAGDFGNAEQLLTAFERAHPTDARVEDATFLRAVARARRGDLAHARAIASDYLRRYPNGLRRAEAERLLR